MNSAETRCTRSPHAHGEQRQHVATAPGWTPEVRTTSQRRTEQASRMAATAWPLVSPQAPPYRQQEAAGVDSSRAARPSAGGAAPPGPGWAPRLPGKRWRPVCAPETHGQPTEPHHLLRSITLAQADNLRRPLGRYQYGRGPGRPSPPWCRPAAEHPPKNRQERRTEDKPARRTSVSHRRRCRPTEVSGRARPWRRPPPANATGASWWSAGTEQQDHRGSARRGRGWTTPAPGRRAGSRH